MAEQNYNFFLRMDLSHYLGQLVAILDNKIISHGNDFKEVYKEAKAKAGRQKPLFTKIPEKETMIL
jgi:hypothetical protein